MKLAVIMTVFNPELLKKVVTVKGTNGKGDKYENIGKIVKVESDSITLRSFTDGKLHYYTIAEFDKHKSSNRKFKIYELRQPKKSAAEKEVTRNGSQ